MPVNRKSTLCDWLGLHGRCRDDDIHRKYGENMTGIDDRWVARVVKGAKTLGVELDEEAKNRLAAYAVELLAWNRKCNLTAITDPMDVAEKHMVDALAVTPYIPNGARLLDMGTGGGFPGIPARIVDSSLDVTLVDAVRKKVSFLKHAARVLKLNGVEAIHARAEELCLEEGRGAGYDVVTSRAFSSIDTFVTMALPFLKPNGLMIAMKGKGFEEDQETLAACEASLAGEGIALSTELIRYELPFSKSQRALFLISVK